MPWAKDAEPALDEIALSLRMKRLTQWLDERCQPASLVRHRVGDGFLTIDPQRQGDIASSNFNRIYLCGRESGLECDAIARWIELFTAHGVKKFFVWLSPGPEMEAVRGWLRAGGLARLPYVRYPTLLRDSDTQMPFRTGLDIREVTPAEVNAAREALGEALWPGYLRSAGKDGFFHYMAFDGVRPVATAALAVQDGIAYLLSAATSEAAASAVPSRP
jgi:hypothetical protein